MGMPHVKLVKREFLNSFLRGVKIFAVGIPGILADAAAREVDSLAGGIGVNSKLKDKVGKALQSVGEAVFPEREVEATVKCAFTLTEHNQLLGEISMESPFYKLENGSFEIAF